MSYCRIRLKQQFVDGFLGLAIVPRVTKVITLGLLPWCSCRQRLHGDCNMVMSPKTTLTWWNKSLRKAETINDGSHCYSQVSSQTL
jgi:hypothetical protein